METTMAGMPPIHPYPMPKGHDLPRNIAQWTVDPTRAVLLIHDMQRYFLRPFPQGVSPRDALLLNIALLRRECSHIGIPVAYTAQPGDMTEVQRGLLNDFWGPGMHTDPDDRQIVAELRPERGDWLLTKWRYSAFFRSDLLCRMRDIDRDQLIICGVYAHVGVLMTAVDAFTNDVQAFIAADAVADFSEDFHRLALDYAAQRCAVVSSTRQITEQVRLTAAADVRPSLTTDDRSGH
jgi:trans-2,3-dihydro-3-hydroxyanthranilic acid synthase